MFDRLDIPGLNKDLRLLAETETEHLVGIEGSLHELWDKRNSDPEVLKAAVKGIGQELRLVVAALKEGEAHLCCIMDFATLELLERAERFASHLRLAANEIADYLDDREFTPVAS